MDTALEEPIEEPKKVDLSEVTEAQINRIDDDTVTKYTVVKEEIDLRPIRDELARLESQLNIEEPTEEEIIKSSKWWHPYYQDRANLEGRISKLVETLNNYGNNR